MAIVDERQKCLEIAHTMLNHRGSCHYTEGPNRWDWHQHKVLTWPFYGDCSSTCTAIDWFAGCGDPNGLNFAWGDTATILAHAYRFRLGENKSDALPADWVLFGPNAPGAKPIHMAMLLQPGTVKDPVCFSMGETGDPHAVPLSVLTGIGFPSYVRNITRHR